MQVSVSRTYLQRAAAARGWLCTPGFRHIWTRLLPPVCAGSVSAARFFIRAFTSHVMSVKWNTRVSRASISEAELFHGSLHVTGDICRMEDAGFHGEHFSSRIFHGSLHFACDVCSMEQAGFHGEHFSSRIFPMGAFASCATWE